jgi:hypothetical protein
MVSIILPHITKISACCEKSRKEEYETCKKACLTYLKNLNKDNQYTTEQLIETNKVFDAALVS